MPTIFHTELEVKKRDVINLNDKNEGYFDLSDGSPENPYFAKFHLDDNGDIIIFSKVVAVEGEAPFTFNTRLILDKDQKRKNGFMQFTFDEDEIPDNCKEAFKKNLTSTFYNKIKEFYHEHECNTGRDSDLHPIIKKEPIQLELDDNPALIGFLKDFSKLFYKNAISVSNFNKLANEFFEDYKFVRQKIEKLQEPKQQDMEEFRKVHDNVVYFINALNKLLENSSIEYTYCKTLLSSIHNKSFKHDIKLNPEAEDYDIKNEYRRQALNIRNSVRYIENIKYKNQNRKNEFTHISIEVLRDITAKIEEQNEKIQEQNEKIDKTLHNDRTLQRIGISLAFYGAAITILFSSDIKNHNNAFNILIVSLTFLLILSMFVDIPKYINSLWKRLSKSK